LFSRTHHLLPFAADVKRAGKLGEDFEVAELELGTSWMIGVVPLFS